MGAEARVKQRRGRLESRWTVVDGLPVHTRVSVEPDPGGTPGPLALSQLDAFLEQSGGRYPVKLIEHRAAPDGALGRVA